MKKPLVSIIIPCFNYGEFVGDAVKTALRQTYDPVEIIVIDDGSTDKSKSILEELNTNNKFTLISRENRGIVATRNEGVRLARGEYVIQLDADDMLDETYVEKCIGTARKYKVKIVYTQAKVFGRAEFVTQAPEFDLEKLKHDGYMLASALLHKSVFKNRNYDSYLNDKGNEDWDLFLDACMDGATAKLIDEPLLLYRKHENHNSRADLFEGTLKELLVRHHILSKQNAKHPQEMSYFSPYIKVLYEAIKIWEEKTNLSSEIEALRSELQAKNHELTSITGALHYRIVNKVKRAISK